MKRIVLSTLFGLLLSTLQLHAQTLFLPNGSSGLGSSLNSNVGIGTGYPAYKLDVKGGVAFTSTLYKTTGSAGALDPALISAYSEHGPLGGGGMLPIITLGFEQGIAAGTDMDTKIWSYARNLSESRNFITVGRNRIDLSAPRILTDGRVGIGISDPTILGSTTLTDYKLFVGGGMIAEKVQVKAQESWPDFVFESNYKLRSLDDVEAFIQTNKHLPEVPSAAEMQAKGQDLGKMDAILLQKIEELTLYMLELKKENESLKQRVEELENK